MTLVAGVGIELPKSILPRHLLSEPLQRWYSVELPLPNQAQLLRAACS